MFTSVIFERKDWIFFPEIEALEGRFSEKAWVIRCSLLTREILGKAVNLTILNIFIFKTNCLPMI